MALELRQATGEDTEFLVALRRLTMRGHFIRAGIPYDESKQRQRALYGLEYALIIEFEGKPAGMLKVDRTQNPWFLSQIQLLPQFQARGWGGGLIGRILEEATEAGEAVQLNVLKGNPAKRLYERMGFVDFEEKEHAWKMRFG